MAAQKLFTVYPATWDPSDLGANVTLDGITNISPILDGTVQTFFADGDIYSQFGWIENASEKVQLTQSDFTHSGDGTNKIPAGATGTLTIYMPKRLAGIGGLDTGVSAAFKAVCGGGAGESGCMYEGINLSAQQSGPGTSPMLFTLTSADGTSSAVAISMATLP